MISQSKIISWEAPEFIQRNRPNFWYFYIVGISVLFFAISIYLKNFLFSIFIVIALFILIFNSKRSPNIIKISVHENGITAGSTFYPFENLSAYCIREESGGYNLVLETNRTFSQHVIIPIKNIDPKIVGENLLYYLNEKTIEKTVVDDIIDYLGF